MVGRSPYGEKLDASLAFWVADIQVGYWGPAGGKGRKKCGVRSAECGIEEINRCGVGSGTLSRSGGDENQSDYDNDNDYDYDNDNDYDSDSDSDGDSDGDGGYRIVSSYGITNAIPSFCSSCSFSSA
jgi:hypothetical protein